MGRISRVVSLAMAAALAAPSVAAASPAAEGEGTSAQLTIGGGLDGAAPLAVIDGRLDRAWVGRRGELAIGVGARLRWRDGEVVTDDWDEPRDAAALLRYLEVARRQGAVDLALAAGALADVAVAHLVRGYTAAVEADVVRAGAHAAAAWDGGRVEAVVDDVVRPVVVGGAVEVALGRRLAAIGATAIDLGGVDPGVRPMMVPTAHATFELGARWRDGAWPSLGAAAVAATEGGAALVVDVAAHGTVRGVRAEGYLEGRAHVGDGAAVPVGPLARVTRERLPAMDTGDAGVGAAIGGALVSPALGEISGELRRAVTGWRGHARLLAGAREPVQVGAWAAIDDRDVAVAAELRARWSPHTISRLEATRTYGRDELGELAPRWQVVAWFGTVVGW
ncbi:MAG: hypothetical protein R2939_20235 [Kofleriaceae bacterium]